MRERYVYLVLVDATKKFLISTSFLHIKSSVFYPAFSLCQKYQTFFVSIIVPQTENNMFIKFVSCFQMTHNYCNCECRKNTILSNFTFILRKNRKCTNIPPS